MPVPPDRAKVSALTTYGHWQSPASQMTEMYPSFIDIEEQVHEKPQGPNLDDDATVESNAEK